MRFLALVPLFFAALAQAEPVTPASLEKVFDLAGIHLLCEQTQPLLMHGLPAEAQKKLGAGLTADALCGDLARRVAKKLDVAQVRQAQALLESPLALRFTAAERAVGASGAQGLGQYRQQLAQRPPRGARLELVKRLDAAAHTSDLAYLLRYEVGKTQALLVLRSRGGDLSEVELASQTVKQAEALRASSAAGVESFMLYAYRQISSDEIAAYAELYETPALRQLLTATLQAIPAAFAARRAQFK